MSDPSENHSELATENELATVVPLKFPSIFHSCGENLDTRKSTMLTPTGARRSGERRVGQVGWGAGGGGVARSVGKRTRI